MNWKRYLPWIGIALFIYILIKIDIREVFQEIINANPLFILIALILLIFTFGTQTLKWFLIAKKQGIKVPFGDALRINIITNFYGFVTPSKIGSAVRAEYLKKYSNNSLGKGLCNFVLDKILDVASLIFMAIFFSLYLSIKFKDQLPFLPINLFALLFANIVLLTIIFINKKRSQILLEAFYRKFLPEKLKEKARLMFHAFYDSIPKKRYFALFFSVNLLNWFLAYTITYFIGRSLGINLPFIYYMAILPIGMLVSLIPITINGLGTREATLIKLFAIFGIGSAKVFSMSIISLFISGIVPAIIVSIFLLIKKQPENG